MVSNRVRGSPVALQVLLGCVWSVNSAWGNGQIYEYLFSLMPVLVKGLHC